MECAPKLRFATDSALLEGDGFELPVPDEGKPTLASVTLTASCVSPGGPTPAPADLLR
jgi:hypothetical protein